MTIKNKRKKKVYSYSLIFDLTTNKASFLKRLKFLLSGRIHVIYKLDIQHRGKIENVSEAYTAVSFKRVS